MRILIIEDTPKHQQDAVEFFSQHPEVSFTIMRTISVRWDINKPDAWDGIISDIYFPPSPSSQQEEPVGVAVMVMCREHNIPCVLNTAGYHHGPRYDWISSLQRALKLPEIVDASEDHHKEAETKNWAKAYETLMRIIKKN